MTATDPTTADAAQAERWARREPLLHLLSRAARGVLTPAEGPLLRAAVEAELDAAEKAHAALERVERMADVLSIPPPLEPDTAVEMIRAAITGDLSALAAEETRP